MSFEWTLKRLGDCCEKIGSGSTPRGGKVTYLDDGPVKLIRSQNVHNDGFSKSGLAFISIEQAEKLSNVSVQEGDVLLNITGDSVARVCQASKELLPARVNQHVAIIRPKATDIDANFLRYFLASPLQQNLMLGLASAGATRNALTKGMIEAFQIPCPPVSLQHSIANVLNILDDRITLLRESNVTLEAVAQALFKSWFVDFDPVRAKSEGILPEGIDEATAALFPDSFEQSELGEIPRGWYYGKIGDVATVKSGFAFKGQSFSDSGLPVIKIKNILGDGTVDLQNIQYIKSNIANVNKKFSLNDGDIIIAMTGATIGKTGIVVKDELTPYLNQRVAKFDKKLDGPNNGWFIYTAFQNKNISEQVLNIASGSAQPNISTSGIESIRLIIPRDLTIIDIFNTFSYSLFENWILNHKKITTLSKIFDILLPRLISGQIRLSDEEEINSKIKVDA